MPLNLDRLSPIENILQSHKMPLPVCRVCLSSNIMTVPSVTDTELRDIYEKLTGTQFNSDDNVPKTLCCYCCWQLQQCCKLTATALHSDKMLRKVVDCNTKNGLKYIHSLPKSRHLTITILKSFSFNGESNEITCEYPRPMMSEKDMPKPALDSLTDYIREKPTNRTLPVTKSSVGTKSLNKTSVMKQNGLIMKQLSLQCLLTGNPGLVITKRKKPVITRNKEIVKQETFETMNEKKHAGELQYETKAMTPEKQDLGRGTFNITKEHEMKLKPVNRTCKIEIFDDNSQTGVLETKQPIFYFCNICKELYKTKENLNEHQKTHKKIEDISKKQEPTLCLLCNKYVMNMNSHKIVHKERRYVCDICGHMSRSKSNLATHLRVHMDVPEIVCEICNKGFKHKSSYVYHKNIHTGERPFSCHICGGRYKQSGQVRSHIRLVHEGLKRFVCDICGKKFTARNKMLIHLTAHANIKPFSCDKCQKVFRTASDMRRHVARYCKVNK